MDDRWLARWIGWTVNGRAGVVVAFVLVLLVGGCAPATSSRSTASPPAASAAASAGGARASSTSSSAAVPSASPARGSPILDPWPLAAIEQPTSVEAIPSLEPGFQCHPCHFLAEDELFGVATTPLGEIAVGVVEPPAQALALVSTDGLHWAPVAGFSGATGSAAVAIASDGPRVAIVGHDTSGAASWAYDGKRWSAAPRQSSLLVPYSAGGMTSVVAFDGSFVAGGFHDDPVHLKASAAVWRSTDGLTWRSDDAGQVFADGRIWGMAARDGVIVAVGTVHDPIYGPAAAWWWTRAEGWRRADLGPDGGGAIRAVVATADGFVAVGLASGDTGARVWRSTNGRSWSAVADQPAFHYFANPVRMQSVTVGPAGLLAGGWRSDQAKGSAVVWTSTDGTTWQATWETDFAGGQVDGVVVTPGGRLVAAGRTGYPDWNTAAVWTRAGP